MYGLWPLQHGQFLSGLACGDEALLSYEFAAALYGVRPDPSGPIEILVPRHVDRSPKGIVVHRRTLTSRDRTWRYNIPVTTIACTIIDLATRLDDPELERAISEAVSRRLTTPDHLLSVLNVTQKRNGAPRLRKLLTRLTFHHDPFQQRNDRLRDQAHTAAGLTQLRFTHWQVRYDPGHVEETLRAVGRWLVAT